MRQMNAQGEPVSKNSIKAVEKAKEILAKGSLLQYGNTLLLTNLPYYLQHKLSQLQSGYIEVSADARKKADKLHQKGFAKIGMANIDSIASDAQKYFAKHKVGKDGVLIMDQASAGEFAFPLYKALKETAEQVLNAYYGSHFQLYWSSIIRYEKAEVDLGTSFGWHLDDNPNELMKIFFYLNDTYESNAAFRTFDYDVTRDLLNQGFISSTAEFRRASQSIITPELQKKKLNILEGKKGTTFIFDNNLIHKGTSPQKGFRNVIVVEVYPSSKRFTIDDVYKSLTVPYSRDYPSNPFYNDLMR